MNIWDARREIEMVVTNQTTAEGIWTQDFNYYNGNAYVDGWNVRRIPKPKPEMLSFAVGDMVKILSQHNSRIAGRVGVIKDIRYDDYVVRFEGGVEWTFFRFNHKNPPFRHTCYNWRKL